MVKTLIQRCSFLLALCWLMFSTTEAQFMQQGSKLVGTGAVGIAQHGYSVSISADGNTAIVGGYLDNSGAGAAWVYTRSGGVWTQQGSKLVGAGGVGLTYQGVSVSLSSDGNTAIVGGYADNAGAGAAWVYTRSGGVWTQQDKLVGTGAVGSAYQGVSVSLSADGNTAIVGGYFDNSSAGAAWVFTRSGGVWTQEGSKLVGTGAVGNASQGYSVSLSADGNTAIVGGYLDNTQAGATWVFTRSGGVWTQQGSKLVGTGAVGSALQGYSVSLSADGNTAIVGEYNDNSGAGAAWVYFRFGLPTITAISDIESDQGGQVRLEWDRARSDNEGAVDITSYGIFRKSSSVLSMAGKSLSIPTGLEMDSSLLGYDFVATVPAYQLPHYQVVVPTLGDSTTAGTNYFRFQVVANSITPGRYYVSAVDSGYSVDNLSPIPPAGLIAAVQAGPQVELSWDSPIDPDVKSYTIYRSATSGFTPAFGDIIGTSNSTGFIDTNPVVGAVSYYRIVAVDIHDNPSAPSEEVAAPVTVMQQFSVGDNWNMVSVPLTVSDYTKTVLFPTAATNAFAYDIGYAAYGILENGRGYWVKFSSGQTISMTGLGRTLDTIDVAEGWNMVGSLSSSMPVSSVASIPGGIVTGNFFGYDGSYESSATLEPGKGYWVKVTQAGQLVLNSTLSNPPVNRIRIEDTGENPPAPPSGELFSDRGMPMEYALSQNYPNPFNPMTVIEYALPLSEFVTLKVYNMLGQEVASLVNEVQDAGYRSVAFDANRLPSGVYTYKITAGTFSDVKKMLLLK
jgi:hypothetical protein